MVREATEKLKSRVLRKMSEYDKMYTSGVVFSAKLKDEPRPVEKVVKGKTRMFFPAPIDALIASRMVLAPIFSTMVQHRKIFKCAVGINMYTEAHDLFLDFVNFADDDTCVFEGDYGGFDTSMPFEIGLAASEVLYTLAQHYGYNDYALLS